MNPSHAPFVARGITATIFGVVCVIAVFYVRQVDTSLVPTMLSVVFVAILLALQLFYFSRPDVSIRSRKTRLVLALQACLAFLPMVVYGYAWSAMPTFVAGTALLILPPVAAWSVFVGIQAFVTSLQWFFSHSWLEVAATGVGFVSVGIAVFGLTRLAALVTALHAARSELAEKAVAHERVRFAHGLRELLGQSLSAITPKTQLAHRLAQTHPGRAQRQLTEIQAIARRALADVRAAAHEYRDSNLDEETRAAESGLAAAHVDVRIDRALGELPTPVRALLSTTLRQGVAHVLTHSAAESCDITMRQSGEHVSLEIVNDGVAEVDSSRWTALTDRAARMNGTLGTEINDTGRFRLWLTVPVTQQEPRAEQPDHEVPESSVPLANWVLVVVFCAMATQGVIDRGYQGENLPQIGMSIAETVLLLLIQLLHFSRPTTNPRSATSYVLLSVQAFLVYLPWLQFGTPLHTLNSGFFTGSVLATLAPLPAWTILAAVVASAGWMQAMHTGSLLDVVYSSASALIVGLTVYGMTWMLRTLTELRATRLQLAQAAVADERWRFARDLHDLLGLSLSAIALKGELAHWLVTTDAGKAQEQLTEILAISKLAMADVQLVASGHAELSLETEFRKAVRLLTAADITVDSRLELHTTELSNRVGTLLATVLREGIANVLQHSKAQHCEITLRQHDRGIVLEIRNDGAARADADRTAGTGISNLSHRIAMLGGEFAARTAPDGRFTLTAKVPT